MKFSREDRKELTKHIFKALAVFFTAGILTLAIGYFNLRPTIALVGALMSLISAAIYTAILMYEEHEYLKKLKAPIIEEIALYENALNNAETSINPIREELKRRSSNTLDSSTSTSLSFLSLERLIEALDLRLNEVAKLISSNTEESIIRAGKLLDKNLVFEKKSSEHLLEHDMPDMPPSTWLDSLHFLSQKVTEDLKKIREHDSPLNTIKKY